MKTLDRVAIVLSVALALAACGGGGGGGGIAASGGAQSTARLVDPNLNLDLSTLSTNFTNHGAGTVALTPQGGTVATHVTTDALAQPTIRIDVTGVDGLTFSETFTPADLQGLVVLPGSPVTLVAGTKTASDSSVRSIVFLAPAVGQFVYSTLGSWGYDLGTSSYGGFVAAGIATGGADIPTTGSASYTGPSIAAYSDGSNLYAVGATANAAVNFGTRNLSFSTTGSQRANVLSPNVVVADPLLNLSGTLSYPAGTNTITGSLTAPIGMTGTAQARFFGPAAAELSGVFRLSGTSRQMEGGFLMRR